MTARSIPATLRRASKIFGRPNFPALALALAAAAPATEEANRDGISATGPEVAAVTTSIKPAAKPPVMTAKLDWEMWQMYKFDKAQTFGTREDQFGLPIFRGEIRSGKLHVISQYFTWESPWTKEFQKRMVKVSYEIGDSKKWMNIVAGDIEVLKIDGENWQGPNAWHAQGASNTIGIMKDAYGFNTGIPGGWIECLWFKNGGWNPDGQPAGQGWIATGTTRLDKNTNLLFSLGSRNKGQLVLQPQFNLDGFRITPTLYQTGFGQGASLDITREWKMDKHNSWGLQYNQATVNFGPGRQFNQGEVTLFARLANGRGAWATLSINQPTNGKPGYFTVNAGIPLIRF